MFKRLTETVPDGEINPQTTEDKKENLLRSCYETLIHLGDLSRYRATELNETKWGPAIKYYRVAETIMPNNGTSWNALAVISKQNHDPFLTIYNVYRSLSVEYPFPSGAANLKLEFNKLHEKHASVTATQVPQDAPKDWRYRFAMLHASCYSSDAFRDHEQLELEFLEQVSLELQAHPSQSLLKESCMLNIAAQSYAAGFPKGKCNSVVLSTCSYMVKEMRNAQRSLPRLQRLNLKTFGQILQSSVSHLEHQSHSNWLGEIVRNVASRLSDVVQRALPPLRLYSIWFLKEMVSFTTIADEAISDLTKDVLRQYVHTLNSLISTFPIDQLPRIEYLLDEDVDSMNFLPFSAEICRARYMSNGILKPKPPSTFRYSTTEEMLGRVRDFVEDGLRLAELRVGSALM